MPQPWGIEDLHTLRVLVQHTLLVPKLRIPYNRWCNGKHLDAVAYEIKDRRFSPHPTLKVAVRCPGVEVIEKINGNKAPPQDSKEMQYVQKRKRAIRWPECCCPAFIFKVQHNQEVFSSLVQPEIDIEQSAQLIHPLSHEWENVLRA